MNNLIFTKKVAGIKIKVSFDSEIYSEDETNKLIAEFIYILTTNQ